MHGGGQRGVSKWLKWRITSTKSVKSELVNVLINCPKDIISVGQLQFHSLSYAVLYGTSKNF